MERQLTETCQIYSALFVDFDNIYLSLENQDSDIAKHFATNPDLWLDWLIHELPCQNEHAQDGKRRILIRKCYLNPRSFGDYRPYFIRSAFEVTDCPQLTRQGKTSTDIYMVMDILDALNHPIHLDEFIILSGDSDFTPVLLRLRKYARRSAVLSAGYVSPAYKAACDHLIAQDTFIRDALGIIDQDEDVELPVEGQEINGDTVDLIAKMAGHLYEVAVVPGGVEASDLPRVYLNFAEFKQGTNWLGFGTLRHLTEAIVSQREDLTIVNGDPWRVTRVSPEEAAVELAAPAQSLQASVPEIVRMDDVKPAISEWVREIVQASQAPVTMAALAQTVRARFGEHVSTTSWLGAGTFKNLLTDLDLGSLEISSVVPGFVFDPARHDTPRAGQSSYVSPRSTDSLDPFSLRYPDLAPLARKVHQLTDTPYLLPEHYARLLLELAREINERGYHLTRTSKTVRDRCVERGARVARSHTNFVLVGIRYAGHRFGENPPEDPVQLGDALVQNTINLCRTAQFDPSEQEIAQIRSWIMGELDSEKAKDL